MTLVMPLADPSYAGIEKMAQDVWRTPAGSQLAPDLDEGGTVHFARFVIVENNLVMASSYDGDFGDYIQMFIHTMGDVFDLIMGFVLDPAPLPVKEHPDAFVDWVMAHNKDSIGFYSAYPQVSAVQIRQAFGITGKPIDRPKETAPPPLQKGQLPEIQGLILRGLGQTMVRHLVLKVVEAGPSRVALGAMATEGQPGPKVTHGADWGPTKPKSAIALGLTASGMEALQIPEESRDSFPVAFREGAVVRAPRVGDWDYNAPELWGPLADTDNVNILVSVYASTAEDLDHACGEVTSHFGAACSTTTTYDGAAFPDNKNNVHFGYRDNISQPIIDGDPVPRPADGPQPKAPPGEFLLGYESQYGGVTLDVPQPASLGVNGSFTAFRVLEQDVDAFEKFLEGAEAQTKLDKELIAAKIVGRWRNGVPLVKSPGPKMPPDPKPGADLNDYGYEAEDSEGIRCPMGSHMRRANPRDQAMHPVGDNHRRRIMRRGMPYGPEWKAGDPVGDTPRGLLGHFIGSSLTLQFETVMGEWINRGMTNPDITGSNDVLIGVLQNPNVFKVPNPANKPAQEIAVNDMQFTYTRGSIYAFLPSMTALRWIGDLKT
jgi:Dyp-type peroxidase family